MTEINEHVELVAGRLSNGRVMQYWLLRIGETRRREISSIAIFSRRREIIALRNERLISSTISFKSILERNVTNKLLRHSLCSPNNFLHLWCRILKRYKTVKVFDSLECLDNCFVSIILQCETTLEVYYGVLLNTRYLKVSFDPAHENRPHYPTLPRVSIRCTKSLEYSRQRIKSGGDPPRRLRRTPVVPAKPAG